MSARILVLAGFCALLGAGATPAQAQTSGGLFNALELHELHLLINSRDLERLRARYVDNTYYPADLHWRDARIRNVGVRSRGLGSRNPTKLGLRIDFNRYVTGQRFLGLASIVLDNLWQDPSMVKEAAAMAFFARVGQPASRESFARVHINGEFQGVYAIVEAVDARYVSRTLGDEGGVLFEYHWLAPYYFEDLGDDLSQYQSRLEAVHGTAQGTVATYAPIREMVRAINALLDSAWRTHVESHVDLPQFLAHAAIETFLSEQDGLLGHWGLNNFYLYRPAGSTRHQFFPWDRDNAFDSSVSSVFRRADQNRLLQKTLTFHDLRGRYLDLIAQCAHAAAQDRWLEHAIVRAASLIAAAAAEDPRQPYTGEERTGALRSLVNFARERPGHVLAEVAQARAARR